jgi:hypothetical protein
MAITIRACLGLVGLLLVWPGDYAVSAHGGHRSLRFPEPPHPDAIGTSVGPVHTSVRRVTVASAVAVHRLGLTYEEIRGQIEGIGWGGQDAANVRRQAHYTYRYPYVLRIPPGWNGTLVVHRHGTGPIALWQTFEAGLGDRNGARAFHESADRFVSDVALSPSRRWAFFAVNQTPIDPGGAFNTLVVDGDPSGGGTPVHSMLDVPIGRDSALVAKRLVKMLAGRQPSVTLGTGHSGGATVNLMLNAGVDHLRTNAPAVLAGDNFVRPYDPSSSRIFDGFVSFARGEIPVVPIDPARGLSAPILFLEGDMDGAARLAVRQVDEMVTSGVDAASVARIYMTRHVPHIDADLVAAITRRGRELAPLLGLPEAFFAGRGDRLKPVSAALLDALRAWIRRGVPPPPSAFAGEALDTDGVPGVDTVAFTASNGQVSRAFPYVDDPALDTIVAPPPISTQLDTSLAEAWARVRSALGARTDPVILSEAGCRRGRFSFISQGPVGAWLTAFDEQTFLDAWGSSAAHQTCRVALVNHLTRSRLYDPTVVSIDILPEHFPNTIDLQSTGRLPVAILSTVGFDATTIVPASLRLAGVSLSGTGGTPNHVRVRLDDVNGDGRRDLVAEFRIERLRFAPHDLVADVWGRTRRGELFSGSDFVDLVH